LAAPVRAVNEMREKKRVLYLALGLILLIGLLAARQASAVAQTPDPKPSPQATQMSEGLPEASGEPEPTATGVLEGVVETRIPEPTATPSRIEQTVDLIAAQAGLAGEEFLGMPATDWINLAISLLFVLAGYLAGTWLIRGVLPRLARRTATDLDDAFLAQAGPGLRWLVVVAVLQFATTRLGFLGAELKTILGDVYYVLGLLLAFQIVWRSIDVAERWYHQRSVEAGREGEMAPVITLLVRVGRVAVAIVGVIILLDHFGVNVTAFATALGLAGLAFSLAAQETIKDAIAGFIILVDRPFRIGDRIEIQGEGTWGDVVDIGLRTTRIRTRDNRMVIVPNSVISNNQVINYTFPDPRYRIETRVGIAYGTDIEMARRVIVEAVRRVEGVLPDRPVDALYAEMGDSAMIFRVRWWVETYADTRGVEDQVLTSLQQALDAAGIECPFPTQSVNLRIEHKPADSPPSLPESSESSG
jgi:MscS family membrane protein